MGRLPDVLSHLNSGEATTILASCGSRGYSAMMLPTCRRGAAAREDIQSGHGLSPEDPRYLEPMPIEVGRL